MLDLSCTAGGINDPIPQREVKGQVQEPSSNTIHPTIEAEVKMAMLLVRHDTFFNLSDHLTHYISKEFKGSAAAENMVGGGGGCGGS